MESAFHMICCRCKSYYFEDILGSSFAAQIYTYEKILIFSNQFQAKTDQGSLLPNQR